MPEKLGCLFKQWCNTLPYSQGKKIESYRDIDGPDMHANVNIFPFPLIEGRIVHTSGSNDFTSGFVRIRFCGSTWKGCWGYRFFNISTRIHEDLLCHKPNLRFIPPSPPISAKSDMHYPWRPRHLSSVSIFMEQFALGHMIQLVSDHFLKQLRTYLFTIAYHDFRYVSYISNFIIFLCF